MFFRIRPAILASLFFFMGLHGCATTPVRLEEHGSWKLHTINDELLYGQRQITLHFDSASRFSGFSGCNHYRGEYRYEDGAIDVLDVVTTTDQRCESAIEEQEKQYLDIIGDAVNYHEQCDLLRLRTAEGDRMLFKRAVKSPVR